MVRVSFNYFLYYIEYNNTFFYVFIGKIIIAKSNNGKIIGNLNLDSAIESVKFSKNPTLGLVAAGK